MNLGSDESIRSEIAQFLRKILISLKTGKVGHKWRFVITFPWKQSKVENHIVVYISLQTPCLARCWFSSYEPKCSQSIRLQDSSKFNISRKEKGIKIARKHQSF